MWAEAIAGGLAGLSQGLKDLEERKLEEEKRAEETRRWNLTHLLAKNEHELNAERVRLERMREVRDAELDPLRKQQIQATIAELQARITDMEARRDLLEQQLGLDRTKAFLDTVSKVRPGTKVPEPPAGSVEPWAVQLALDPNGQVRPMVPHEIPLQHALQRDIADRYVRGQALGPILMYAYPNMPPGVAASFGLPPEVVPKAGGSVYSGIAARALTSARNTAIRSVDAMIQQMLATNQISTTEAPEIRRRMIEQISSYYQSVSPEQFWLNSDTTDVPVPTPRPPITPGVFRGGGS